MAAPKGNTFYKYVQKPTGRPKKYTPKSLWAKAQQYFEWVVKNPLYEMKAFANGTTKYLPKMRAMSELAFCLFAGIERETFSRYKKGAEGYKEFLGIASKISDIIYQQKFEGASADLLNSGIIARDLGLREKTEITGLDGGPVATELKIINIASNIPLAESEEDIT